MSAKVLVIDDERAMCELLAVELERAGYAATVTTESDRALAALEREHFDVVVTDIRMPGRSGIELCREVAQMNPELPVIVMTGFGSMEAAIDAIRAGAYDFLTKPFPFKKLQVSIERALEHSTVLGELRRLRSEARELPGLDDLIGASPSMKRAFAMIERLAPSEASVLLAGESGTGKELAARALHRMSRRAKGPCVTVNCAAIPEQLFESELFGYVKGAFSGADRDREGLMRRADGGTLFLDEIGEMPTAMQPKLLRVLQEGKVRPVGSDAEYSVNVRVVSATNRDLARDVSTGAFRRDLYYRLAVVTVPLPPLRERGEDILLLAEHFLDEICDRLGRPRPELGEAAARVLMTNPWPGNVRELRNWIEHAVAMSDGGVIVPDQLPDAMPMTAGGTGEPEADAGVLDEACLESLETVEARHILHVLDAVGGNKTKAAKILGIDRKTLLARLHRYGLEPR